MKLFSHFANLTKICLCSMFILIGANVFAQSGSYSVSGTIVDQNKVPVIGCAVIDQQTGTGTVTNADGYYEINTAKGNTLAISCIGYVNQTVTVGESKIINVLMAETALELDELVVVGYATQKRATLSGAIASVNNKEIITTKNENVQNMLTGKVSGLRVVQNSSEPGQFNTSMDIRGFGSPLVIIDGVQRGNMSRLDSEDIESISVLKDASAAIYGVQAANGVILITTKSGHKGDAVISYSGNVTFQRPSNFPDLCDAVEWMTLYNEMSNHNVDNQVTTYTDAQIDEYRTGVKKSTDWKNEVFREVAPQTQHTVSVNGGTDKVTYYASLGYQNQGSFLKTNAINYEKFNLRSNISANIARDFKFDLNLAGLIDKRNQPSYGSWDIVRGAWLMQPMDQVYYNQELDQYWQPSNGGLQNPVAMMRTDMVGNNVYKSKWFQSNAALTWNVPFVKGLYAKGSFSYDTTINDNSEFSKAYHLYTEAGNEVTWLRQTQSDYKVSRYNYTKDHLQWRVQVGYDNSFGKHNVSAFVLYEDTHNVGDNIYAKRQVLLPLNHLFAGMTTDQEGSQSASSSALYEYSRKSIVGRVTYNYDEKYMAEFAFRRDGSSRFPSNSRWGNFPSGSIAWNIAKENFWKDSALSFIEKLKIRASYGVMGDDSALSYQFVTGYSYPASGSAAGTPAGAIFDGKFVSSTTDKGIANTGITWYTVKTANVGIDFEAWNGLLGLSADFFRRDREGLLATRLGSLPGNVGASLPQENLNSDRNMGFELEASHINHIGDFYYQVKGNISFTRAMTVHYEMAKQGNSYLNWRNGCENRLNSIWWGYGSNGRIENWDEIYYNPVYIGRGTILGDYEYEDWNNDGWINDLDVHPIATQGTVPLVNFGLTLSGQWRGFDLNILFQGASRRYVTPGEFMYQPLWANTNAITQFLDRWHPADAKANPYDPATQWTTGHYAYTGSNPNANSLFNVQNAKYVRLKTIELGYSLPKSILSYVNMSNLRVYVSGYNLLTFTPIKYVDPEFASSVSYGYQYPINKTVTLGVNVKF